MMTTVFCSQSLLQLSQIVPRSLYHSHNHSFSFFDWSRTTTTSISGSTSSVMKRGQGTSLLSHLVLTTFVKSPFSPSIIHPIFPNSFFSLFSSQIVLFFHSLLKEKNLPLALPILFNSCCIARSLHPLPDTIPHCPMTASHPN